VKQQCCLAAVYVHWARLAGGVVLFAIKGYWSLVIAWFLTLPLAAWAYIRLFASISRFLGYGSIEDKAPEKVPPTRTEVTIYTALGCPFCPIVKGRLMELREAMGFSLKEVDVTLRPGVLIAKGIRALPVVECGTWRVEGNATSEKLANLIAGSYAGEPILARST
jgi:hypothetical protein